MRFHNYDWNAKVLRMFHRIACGHFISGESSASDVVPGIRIEMAEMESMRSGRPMVYNEMECPFTSGSIVGAHLVGR